MPAPQVILWFFDSRGGSYYQQRDSSGREIPQPNWVDEDVVNWFTSERKRLNRKHDRYIPSIAFVHIPVNAMLAFQQDPGVSPHYEPGINDDDPLAQQGHAASQGSDSGSTFSYGGQDIPFMQALLDTPGLIAVFR